MVKVDKMVWFNGLIKLERMSKSLTTKTSKMFLAYGNRLLRTAPYPSYYARKSIVKATGGTVRVVGDGIMTPFQLAWNDDLELSFNQIADLLEYGEVEYE